MDNYKVLVTELQSMIKTRECLLVSLMQGKHSFTLIPDQFQQGRAVETINILDELNRLLKMIEGN